MSPMEFNMRVVALSKERKISIAQLERNTGFPLGTIKSWKKAIPSGDKILRVAQCLDVSIDYLFGRTENQLSHKIENLPEPVNRILETSRVNNVSDKAANIVVTLIEVIMSNIQ